jgi:hypothetical protein
MCKFDHYGRVSPEGTDAHLKVFIHFDVATLQPRRLNSPTVDLIGRR